MVHLPRPAPLALALATGALTTSLAYAVTRAQPEPAAVARPVAAPVVLASPTPQPPLWYRLAPGYRAIAVPLTEASGVAGFVQPGTRVDVLAVVHEQDHWSSEIVAQNLTVLAVAQADERQDKAKVASSATLRVTPAQAQAIGLAAERGAIRLALRGPADQRIAKASPLRPKPLVAPISAPRPVAAAPIAPLTAFSGRPTTEAQPAAAGARAAAPTAAARPAEETGGIEIVRGTHSEVVKP